MQYLVSLGSNKGDKAGFLRQACSALEQGLGKISAVSGIYETEPIGFESSDMFFNQVIILDSPLAPGDLIVGMLNIEVMLGRARQLKGLYESREIDLDILLAEQLVVQGDKLIIPHPRMHLRGFVLVPACEIAAGWVHPVLNKTLMSLCDELSEEEKTIVRI